MKRWLRRLLFKNLWIFGRLSIPLIRFSYFIKASQWFHKLSSPYKEGDRYIVFNELIKAESLENSDFIYLEFGVSKGGSFNYWLEKSKNPNNSFWGFDTFEGIPEDWGSVKAGAYTAHGKAPELTDPRANFCVGLFNKTLLPFLKTHELSKKLIIHFDADLYSSTLYVLLQVQPFLKVNDILIFDEFFSVSKSDHELRAFEDFLYLFPLKFSSIIKTPNQLAIKIDAIA